MPAPHVLEHADHGPKADILQATLHFLAAQILVSRICGQSFLLFTVVVRVRNCLPATPHLVGPGDHAVHLDTLQLFVHAVHRPNADMAQSTGQAWRLHQRISCDCGHADPP